MLLSWCCVRVMVVVFVLFVHHTPSRQGLTRSCIVCFFSVCVLSVGGGVEEGEGEGGIRSFESE